MVPGGMGTKPQCLKAWYCAAHGTSVESTNSPPSMCRKNKKYNWFKTFNKCSKHFLGYSLHDSYFVESAGQIIIFSFSIFLQVPSTPWGNICFTHSEPINTVARLWMDGAMLKINPDVSIITKWKMERKLYISLKIP